MTASAIAVPRCLVARVRLTAGREAVRAVDRAVTARLERNTSRAATLGTHGIEEFTLATAHAAATVATTATGRVPAAGIAASLVGAAAVGAAGRPVGEALLLVEALLTGREDEFLTAIAASQRHVLEILHEAYSLFRHRTQDGNNHFRQTEGWPGSQLRGALGVCHRAYSVDVYHTLPRSA